MTCRNRFFCYKSQFEAWKILSFCFLAKNNPPNAELVCDSDSKFVFLKFFRSRAGSSPASRPAAGNRPKAGNIQKDFCLADYLQTKIT